MPTYVTPYDEASMMPKDLKYTIYEKKEHIAYVTLNRPEVKNAAFFLSYIELGRCWNDINLDPNIWVAIITGAGAAFCAGRDVKILSQYQKEGRRVPNEDPADPLFGQTAYWRSIQPTKPVIGAINGFAVGFGLALALSCDLRVMAEDAWLGDQHTNVGQLGGPDTILKAMPPAIAAYMTMCNGRLTAQDCYRLGIANKVVPREQLMPAAEELAEMVLASSPVAVQAAKRLYSLARRRTAEMDYIGRQLDIACRESEDGAEGPRAFAQKRKPLWKNR